MLIYVALVSTSP